MPRAAASTSFMAVVAIAFFGFTSTAIKMVGDVNSRSSCSRFGISAAERTVAPVGVAARPIEAGGETKLDGIAARRNDDRQGRHCGLHGTDLNIDRAGKDHSHLTANEIGGQLRKPIELSVCPAEFDRYVLAFDIAGFVQAAPERGHEMRVGSGRPSAEKADHRLLRARRERPRRRAAI
jgi:hypothetical protein